MPSLRFLIAGKVEDEDLLERGPLQDFLTTMSGANTTGCSLKLAGVSLSTIDLIEIDFGSFSRVNASGHFLLLSKFFITGSSTLKKELF